MTASKNYTKWFILFALALVWGSSFILMKRGLESFSSVQVASLRISLAALFLLPVLIKYRKINLKKYGLGFLLAGVFGNLIPAFLFTKAETGISSSLAGMLNALTPLFTVVVARLFFKGKTSTMQIVGVLTAFIGALFLLSGDKNASGTDNLLYAFYVILATICYAISVNSIKHFLDDVNSVAASAWYFALTGPIALFILFNTDFLEVMQRNPNALNSLGYVAILGIIGSALSVIFFNYLIKVSGAVFASSSTYLIPIVAIFWGFFDGEVITIIQIAAIFVILGGVWLINKKKEKK
ncbi:MAG: DMT family transporter [Bacteroidetes bacterium]|nr:DMT family transporter [Bacteroidota bacterium]